MTVWALTDFKTILRYAKLARLMHTIAHTDDGHYRIRFDGPASVLRGTRRYGIAFARFLPALIACRDWRMHAVVRGRAAWKLSLDLCSADGLTSHLPRPDEFDSSIEESFANKWGTDPRDGWRLEREGEILHHGQKAFVPDFAFRHEDGRSVLMEIIGYWTPEYLAAKLKTLDEFRDQNILLAVAESLSDRLPASLPNTITYKSRLKISAVLQALDEITATRR
jgi:predicted nuclease of restriction endonuclease-like RecB superfamily